MESITQVAVLAVTGAVCAAVIKRQTPDVALGLAICAAVLILAAAMGTFASIRGLMDTLARQAGLSAAVLTPVVKTVGVALLTRVTAELCRDAKESGLASAVEIAGGAAALVICLPLFEAVLQLILDLV